MAYGDLNYAYEKGYRFLLFVYGWNSNGSYFSGLPYPWNATDDLKRLVLDRPDTTQKAAAATTLTWELESTEGDWSPAVDNAFTYEPKLNIGYQVELQMWNGSVWKTLFWGTVQDVREDLPYTRAGGRSQRITVVARDDTDVISRAPMDAITAAGDGDDMEDRIQRVLDEIGYTAFTADGTRANARQLYSTTLGVNAMAEIQAAAIGTGNVFYVARDGSPAAVDPTALSTSLWVYVNPEGDSPAPPSGTDPVAFARGVTVQRPLDGLVNQVVLNGVNTGVWSTKVGDAASVSAYGLRGVTISGLTSKGASDISDTATSYLSPDPVPQLSNLVIPVLAPELTATDYLRDWIADTMEVGEQVEVNVYPEGSSAWGESHDLTLRGWRLSADAQDVQLLLRVGRPFPWSAGAAVQRGALATVTDVSGVESQLADKVDVAGDTMTGPLLLQNGTSWTPLRSRRTIGGTEYRAEFGVTSSGGNTVQIRTLNSSDTEQAAFKLPMSSSGRADISVGLQANIAGDAFLAGNGGSQPDGPLRIKLEAGGQGRVGLYASGWQEWILIGADKIQWGTQGGTRMNLHSGGDLSVQGAIRAGDVSTTALTNGYLYATPGSSSGWDAHWALASGSTYYLVRVTSTRRDKKYITYRDDLADVALAPIRYKRRKDRGGDITPGWQYGFLAEDIAEQDTDGALTLLDEDGLPAGYSTHGLLAVLAAKANRAEDELAELRRELQQVRRAMP